MAPAAGLPARGSKKVVSVVTRSGASRFMMARIRSGAARCDTRKVTDSGSLKYRTGSTTNGKTPPITSTLCHPRFGIIQALAKPPTAAPNEKPQKATVIKNERLRVGAYSLTRILAFGMAAPRPSPVRKRKTTRLCTSGAKAVAMVSTPNRQTLHSSTILRP